MPPPPRVTARMFVPVVVIGIVLALVIGVAL